MRQWVNGWETVYKRVIIYIKQFQKFSKYIYTGWALETAKITYNGCISDSIAALINCPDSYSSYGLL